MNRTGTPLERAEYYLWKFPGAPVHVRIGLEVVRRMREYLNAYRKRNPNLEATGLLLGKPHRPGVEIDDFAPMFGDENCAPPFTLSDAQKLDLRNSLDTVSHAGSEPSVVGYFRSDLREGIRLYDDDLALIKEFFSDRSNVFLIIRPGDTANPTAGFFFWEGDRIFSSCSFMEFDFNERMLASDSYRAEAATVPNAQTLVTHQAAIDSPPQNRSHSMRWAVGAGLVVAFGLAFGAYRLVQRQIIPKPSIPPPVATLPAPPPVRLGLTVSQSGTDIGIVWNGLAPVVADARVGVLTIEDGDVRRELPLTPVQLRSGRLIYAPRGSSVYVALEIFAHDGKVVRETLVAIPNMSTKGVTAAPSLQPSEPLIIPRKPTRDFVPPVVRSEPGAALDAMASEAPPLATTRPDVPRIDLPVLPAPLPEPLPKDTPRTPDSVRRSPVPLKQVRPALPPNVKAMVTSRVVVKVQVGIDATGKVESAEPLAGPGSLGRFLGAAAANAARMWTFEPATLDGRKISGELTLEFVFTPDR